MVGTDLLAKQKARLQEGQKSKPTERGPNGAIPTSGSPVAGSYFAVCLTLDCSTMNCSISEPDFTCDLRQDLAKFAQAGQEQLVKFCCLSLPFS